MTPGGTDPLRRFTCRVDNYVRYRPAYPDALVRHLAGAARIDRTSFVADVGSGTGIFTKLLLDLGATVFAVEPNAAMRRAAELWLAKFPHFRSVDGAAERTGLGDRCVSLVTCAQAFHWFDRSAARDEFMRILRPGGLCALIWNTPVSAGSPFAEGFEDIKLRYGTDFRQVRHENIEREPTFAAFFGNREWERLAFENSQALDLAGLVGRVLSSSYAPGEDDPRHAPMLAALKALFDRCQRDGKVRIEYETELFLGRLAT
jgi:SAM-dependent methyltransferase